MSDDPRCDLAQSIVSQPHVLPKSEIQIPKSTVRRASETEQFSVLFCLQIIVNEPFEK